LITKARNYALPTGVPEHARNDIATRRFAMFLMNENLARAHMDTLYAEARQASVASRLARAQRLERRAENVAMRARRANARVD